MRATPIGGQTGLRDFAPVRLLPIRLTVDPLAAEDKGVVPIVPPMSDHSPRVTLNVVELVGSPSIWTARYYPSHYR